MSTQENAPQPQPNNQMMNSGNLQQHKQQQVSDEKSNELTNKNSKYDLNDDIKTNEGNPNILDTNQQQQQQQQQQQLQQQQQQQQQQSEQKQTEQTLPQMPMMPPLPPMGQPLPPIGEMDDNLLNSMTGPVEIPKMKTPDPELVDKVQQHNSKKTPSHVLLDLHKKPFKQLTPYDILNYVHDCPDEILVDVVSMLAMQNDIVFHKVDDYSMSDPNTRKIFVRGLTSDCTLEQFREAFVQFGQIEDIIIVTDKNTGKSKGYGFITYRTPFEAENAIEVGTLMLNDKRTHISLAIPSRWTSNPTTNNNTQQFITPGQPLPLPPGPVPPGQPLPPGPAPPGPPIQPGKPLEMGQPIEDNKQQSTQENNNENQNNEQNNDQTQTKVEIKETN